MRLSAWVLGIAVAILAVVWLGPLRLLETLSTVSSHGGVNRLLDELRSYWPWTPLVILLLMVLESFLVPLPAGPLVAANTLLFGLWAGFFISWVGAVVGAAACFWVARVLGRKQVARWVKPKDMDRIDQLTAEHGFRIVLFARLIPVANSAISFVAGLSLISFGKFVLASMLGIIPWLFLFSLLAQDLMRAQQYAWRLGILISSVGFGYLLFRYRKPLSSMLRRRRLPRLSD